MFCFGGGGVCWVGVSVEACELRQVNIGWPLLHLGQECLYEHRTARHLTDGVLYL